MGAEIDRLEVQVEAQATKANNQLDIMVQRLERVASSLTKINSGGMTGLANGVSRFAQASSQLSNVKKTDFNRLVKSVERLYDLDVQKMYSASSAITTMSKAVSGLGTVFSAIGTISGSKVDKAIAKLPAFADALSQFMTVMSKAPKVSQNVIYMTDAMARLASQGGNVEKAAKATTKALNDQSKSAKKSSHNIQNLSAALVVLQQAYRAVSRIGSKLYGFSVSSMDFLETTNYFEVAMRDIGNSAAAQWKENGYASAEAYAESFSKRAKQLTTKMTGYAIDKDGNATYVGMKNLGMDPDKVMQYQATFAQISSSMGVAEESALNFSKALTMLGADWASLRNLTFEQGWEKFASALAGQSRAVRSLGIDITNATLQEYAYKYGLEQAVSEMNQATKAQLRLLAILDQSKVAYGDLANTIESPANQIRMFQQNVGNLSRVIGNMFLPTLQKVLPYINGVTIAMQKLFTWIGSLMGIKFDSVNSSMGGMSDEMYDLVDGADDLADGISEADKAAKKLNKTLQGWHEINNITTSNSGNGNEAGIAGGNALLDGAIAEALADYEKAWNDAFERMENKTQIIAQKIFKAFEPLKNIILDFMTLDFGAAGHDTSKLVAGIFNFISDAIDNVDWVSVGQRVGKFIAGIDWKAVFKSAGKVIGSALNASFDFWLGMFSAAPVESFLITLTKIPKLLTLMTSGKIVTGITKLSTNFKTLTKNTKDFLSHLGATGKPFAFSRACEAIRFNLTDIQKGMIGVVAVSAEFFLLKDGFYDLAKGSDHFVASLAKIAVGAGVASTALYMAFGPTGLAVAGITAVVAAIVGIKGAMDDIHAEIIGNAIHNALCYPGGVALSEITAQYAQVIGSITEGFTSITEKSSEMDQAEKNIQAVWMEIEKIETAMEAGVMSVEEGKTELERLFGELAEAAANKVGIVVDTLYAAFGENGVMRDVYERLGHNVENVTKMVELTSSRMNERVQELTQRLSEMDPGTPEYTALKAEINSLISTMADADMAVENYKLALSQINVDYDELFNNGEIDTDKIDAILKQITDAAKNANADITTAVENINISLAEMYRGALQTGDMEAAAFWKEQMEVIPDALELLKSDVSEKALEFTDLIQTDLIARTKDVLKNASNEFQNQNWFYKTFVSYEEKDMREALGEYNKNILVISAEIEKSFNELGVNGAGWAASAAQKMYDELVGYYGTYYKLPLLDTVNYEDIINQNLSGIADTMKGHGRDAVAGYCEGLKDQRGIAFVGGYAEDLANIVAEAIAEAQDSHSPSKVTEALGKDAVMGYGLGIEENTKNTIDSVKNYMESVLSAFAMLPRSMMDIGQQTTQGLIDGIESLEGALYDKINRIVKNISDSLNCEFEINGMSTGIILGSIPKYSTGGYPEDGLFMANHGELVGRFANGQTAVANNDQIAAGIEEAAYRGMARALLERRDSTNVNIQVEGDPDGIFKVVQKEAWDFQRRNGGKPAFS